MYRSPANMRPVHLSITVYSNQHCCIPSVNPYSWIVLHSKDQQCCSKEVIRLVRTPILYCNFEAMKVYLSSRCGCMLFHLPHPSERGKSNKNVSAVALKQAKCLTGSTNLVWTSMVAINMFVTHACCGIDIAFCSELSLLSSPDKCRRRKETG